MITEVVTKILKKSEEKDDETIHQLLIETNKSDGRNWVVHLEIHIPNEYYKSVYNMMPNFICDFYLNEKELEKDDFDQLIGRKILKKEHYQMDEHTEGTPDFSVSHMTKMSLYLDNDDILSMRIAEVYDSRLDNYYEHTGGDVFL